MTHVTCRLTAKNRDQLRNPTFYLFLLSELWRQGLKTQPNLWPWFVNTAHVVWGSGSMKRSSIHPSVYLCVRSIDSSSASNSSRRVCCWAPCEQEIPRKEASILWSHHEETKELPGERNNAKNNARCMQARKKTHSLDGQHQDLDRTSWAPFRTSTSAQQQMRAALYWQLTEGRLNTRLVIYCRTWCHGWRVVSISQY